LNDIVIFLSNLESAEEGVDTLADMFHRFIGETLMMPINGVVLVEIDGNFIIFKSELMFFKGILRTTTVEENRRITCVSVDGLFKQKNVKYNFRCWNTF